MKTKSLTRVKRRAVEPAAEFDVSHQDDADHVPAYDRGTSTRDWGPILLPLAAAAVLVVLWQIATKLSGSTVFPTPVAAFQGLIELIEAGLLLKYIGASLFRVIVSFLLAVAVGVPVGLVAGWFPRVAQVLNPLIQLFRPISPIAWIPITILWFGLSEAAPMFLIFLSSVFPITLSAMAAVRSIQPVYIRAARNFGLTKVQLFRRIILPATLPDIITGCRIALGIAWLVVVAAEMIVVNPKIGGLGYLIIDARNAGSRYDLVVAGMICIGIIGLVLDMIIRQLERLDSVRWGYGIN